MTEIRHNESKFSGGSAGEDQGFPWDDPSQYPEGVTEQQVAVSRLLTTIGIPVLATVFGVQPTSIALWISKGRIPPERLKVLEQHWPDQVRESGYFDKPRLRSAGWRLLPGAEYARIDDKYFSTESNRQRRKRRAQRLKATMRVAKAFAASGGE